ncbi:MAG: hypothetical protein IK104_01925 [Clostridia bacterium]|nr:hypothetical protein [Clostridia bacterium]
MKKIFALLLALTLLLCASCAGNKPDDGVSGDPSASNADVSKNAEPSSEQATRGSADSVATDAQGNTIPGNYPTAAFTSMQEFFTPSEYVLYYDIFYNKKAAEYAGETVTKKGTFAILDDQYFGGGTRYYVWGYNDQTRCCDFQWEFVPNDPSSLPLPGSAITVTGVTEQNDSALDKFWIKNADVTVDSQYTISNNYDYDLTTMSPTLARVQIINMVNEKSKAAFDGKTVLVYGRILDDATVQHPYYNGAWELPFDADRSSAIGTYVILGGTLGEQADGVHLTVDSYTEL